MRTELYKAVKHQVEKYGDDHGMGLVEMWETVNGRTELDGEFWLAECIKDFEHDCNKEEAGMKYKVTFAFWTEAGEVRTDYFDNNGRGHTLSDADDIARQLRQNGHWNVSIEEMDRVPGGRYWEPQEDAEQGQDYSRHDEMPFA